MTDAAFCTTCGSHLDQGATSCQVCGAAAPLVSDSLLPAPTPDVRPAEVPPHPRASLVPIAVIVVGLLVATVTVVVARNADGGLETAGGEIFLETAAAPGPEPFTEAVDPAAPASSVVPTPSGPGLAAPVGVAPMSGTAPSPGSPPYGGSGDDRVCDREQLISFLTTQPERAAAWAGVLGVAVADIEAYVRSLTPTVLLYDTRVTNHGFDGTRATPRQSVLQAGTAVLVDANGDPVARCRCGNPLLPPQPVRTPAIVGAPWPGFDPTVLVAVNAGVTVTVVIEATDPAPPATAAPGGQSEVSDDDLLLAEGLVATVAECVAPGAVDVLDVQTIPDRTGAFSILLDVEGTEMLFIYEPDTGIITEGDRPSAELLAACGVS
jgi:hypothetical protein